MSERLKADLLDRLNRLDDVAGASVLEFVKRLDVPKPLVTFDDYKQLQGTLRPELLDEMERIIEEDCERIDEEGW